MTHQSVFSCTSTAIKTKLALFFTLFILSFQAQALDFVFTNDGYFGKGNKYAIEGYDAVAYFTEGKPAKGKKSIKFTYRKATWLFKNESNLAAFKANPQKYAPQYGGHCAWKMAVDGKGVYGDPNVWTIVDGKLYLNYNAEANKQWKTDIPGSIKKADGFWLGQHKFKSLN